MLNAMKTISIAPSDVSDQPELGLPVDRDRDTRTIGDHNTHIFSFAAKRRRLSGSHYGESEKNMMQPHCQDAGNVRASEDDRTG